jgi:hypothetical protein
MKIAILLRDSSAITQGESFRHIIGMLRTVFGYFRLRGFEADSWRGLL